jgi:glyoxylase-like metal-dependent hydrolase (beta-lactamase superfamily II)
VSSPSAVAELMERIAPRLYRWHVSDDRIGGAQSDSYALDSARGVVFVDPLPLTQAAAERFPAVAGCYLTSTRHQRSSWRYRQEHGARIWAPNGGRGLDGEPDRWYTDATRFPGGFEAIQTPGPEIYHYAFLRREEPAYLFVGDLVVRRDSSSPLTFDSPVPHENPAMSRRSVERLLDLDFDLLCLSHGGYIADDPQGALRDLLDRTA